MLKNELFNELAVTMPEGEGEGVQPVVDTQVEPIKEGEQLETKPLEGAGEPPSDEIEIDGEKFKIDDVREWRKGNLRQSDYTKKTQEIAKQREQYKEAVELYEFLQKNPTYAQKLAELAEEENIPVKTPTDPRLVEIDMRLTSMQIEKDLTDIKNSDPDVDEIELLNLANEMKMPIKQAYYMWRGQNYDKLLEKKLASNSAQLTEQIKKGQQVTKTLVKESGSPVQGGNFGLTPAEIKVADGMGMSYEEYAKWK